MIYIDTCLLSASLLAGLFASFIFNKRDTQLQMTFDETQHKIYQLIVKERTIIFGKGLVLGILVSWFYMNWANELIANNLCSIIVITLATSIFFYTLSPKQHQMIRYLKGDQVYKWHKRGMRMRKLYMGSFLIGFIFYLLIIIKIYESQKK